MGEEVYKKGEWKEEKDKKHKEEAKKQRQKRIGKNKIKGLERAQRKREDERKRKDKRRHPKMNRRKEKRRGLLELHQQVELEGRTSASPTWWPKRRSSTRPRSSSGSPRGLRAGVS